MSKTLFEKSQQDQHAYSLPYASKAFQKFQPNPKLIRKEVFQFPEVSEIDLTRHFAEMAKKNMGIDTNFYPLGSCTMKLNPRINEVCASLPGFSKTHPLAPEDTVQGNLQVIFELLEFLKHITGMEAGTVLPNAGAQGEFTGVRMIAAYHQERQDFKRDEILIPDNAHGTNPATAAMAGFKTVSIKTNAEGDMDLEHLQSLVSDRTAGLMLTNPNTLGIFSPNILKIAKIVHEHGGLLYYDGANLNPILNIARPGDMGFDVMHINLHKTFSTPHGGGGPGSGVVMCKLRLEKFLPTPKVVKKDNKYEIIWNDKTSIGRMASFHGNFGIYLRAYAYSKFHGHYGMRRIGEIAVLNANYLKKQMEELFTIPFPQPCMHEFVVQADNYVEQGVRALDIAKRMLDYGIHAPTIYFPLIIKECLLIEPTESESKATLDRFIEIMKKIVEEIKENPEILKNAPYTTSVRRLDEARAAKNPILIQSNL